MLVHCPKDLKLNTTGDLATFRKPHISYTKISFLFYIVTHFESENLQKRNSSGRNDDMSMSDYELRHTVHQ